MHFQKACYTCSQPVSENLMAPNLCKLKYPSSIEKTKMSNSASFGNEAPCSVMDFYFLLQIVSIKCYSLYWFLWYLSFLVASYCLADIIDVQL